jgi:opacity protein-like surface antigen
MKKLLLAAAAVAALATPAYASHWECTVQKDTHSMNRPNARYPEWRLPGFEKGDVISIRDTVGRWDLSRAQVLVMTQDMDGCHIAF